MEKIEMRKVKFVCVIMYRLIGELMIVHLRFHNVKVSTLSKASVTQ